MAALPAPNATRQQIEALALETDTHECLRNTRAAETRSLRDVDLDVTDLLSR